MTTTITLSHYDAESETTTTITFTNEEDTVLRLDRRLQKNLGKMPGLNEPRPVVMDHLQNEHIWVLTWNAKGGALATAWEKVQEVFYEMQNTGHTWKLTLNDSARGINNFFLYVVCDSIDCPDIAGMVDDMEMILTLLETKNWEAQP